MQDKLLEYFKTLSPSQRILWTGNLGMALSGVSTGIFGYQIVEGMNMYVFAACSILATLGWWGTQRDEDRKANLKIADLEFREEKIKAGLDPSLDKTIIRVPEDT